jgi:hypothetical protein
MLCLRRADRLPAPGVIRAVAGFGKPIARIILGIPVEGPVLAMLALLRVAPRLPSPTLRAVPGVVPGRDGEAGSLIELES